MDTKQAIAVLQNLRNQYRAAEHAEGVLTLLAQADGLKAEREKQLASLSDRIAELEREASKMELDSTKRREDLDRDYDARMRELAAQMKRDSDAHALLLADAAEKYEGALSAQTEALTKLAEQRSHLSDEVAHLEGEQTRLEAIIGDLREKLGRV